MKLKLSVLWNSLQALQQVKSYRMDITKAFPIRKLLAEIQVEIDHAEGLRKDLIKKHGTETMKEVEGKDPVPTGNFEVQPSTPEYEAFLKEFNALLDTEIELKELDKALLLISDLAGNKVQPAVLAHLDWLIVDEKPVDKE